MCFSSYTRSLKKSILQMNGNPASKYMRHFELMIIGIWAGIDHRNPQGLLWKA
jgi:hypothetical protein